MKKFFREFFFLIDHEGKRKLIVLMALFSIAPLFDVFGLGMIGAFIALISDAGQFIEKIPFYTLFFSNMTELQVISTIGVLVISAFLMKAVVIYCIQKYNSIYSYQLALRLKLKLMKAFQLAPYGFHLKKNSAYLLNRMVQADSFVGGVLLPVLSFVSSLMVGLTIAIFLFVMHPMVTVALGALFGMSFFMNEYLFARHCTKLGKVTASTGGEIFKAIKQALDGIVEVRVFGRENYFFKKVRVVAKDFARSQSTYSAFQLIPRYAIECILVMFVVSLCLIQLNLGKSATEVVTVVGIFAVAGTRLIPIITQLTSGINQIKFSYPTMSYVYDELKSLEPYSNEAVSLEDKTKMPFSSMMLQDVSYRYETSKHDVISNVTLSLKKGESLALIGPSGAGKSTLVNIILGLLPIQSGELLVDNQSIQDKKKWLNNFAYIPQQIYLLDDSLKHNIALGVEDDMIDHEHLQRAISMARLDQVVLDLPHGVDTLIGENGIRLSGGQRQRIALARAFYHERDIIIMDEATSALDNETEYEIIESIKALHGVKTLIVIAHRLTTIEHCDVIYELQAGKIIAKGSYQDVVVSKQKNMHRESLLENA